MPCASISLLPDTETATEAVLVAVGLIVTSVEAGDPTVAPLGLDNVTLKLTNLPSVVALTGTTMFRTLVSPAAQDSVPLCAVKF